MDRKLESSKTFRKPFDTVSTKILLEKLLTYGLNEPSNVG